MSSPSADPADPADPRVPEQPSGPAGRPVGPTGVEQVAETEPEPNPQQSRVDPYDAVLLFSFGGPEAEDEVMPFLRRVTRGRGIPDERLAEVGEHYYQFGGRSPINDQNRALLAELRAEMQRRGLVTPVLWANRFSEPFLADTLRSAHEQGLRRVVAVTTSAYSSYSSCRAYREDLAEALSELTDEGLDIAVDKIRPYYNHPGFSATNAALTLQTVREVIDETGTVPRLVFVTHSVPDAMDDTSGPGDGPGNAYSSQHLSLAAAIAEEAGVTIDRELGWDLVYCSRSGPPTQPWLEPDVNDHLTALAADGTSVVVLVPIGFVSDHMEVLFDLDTEAAATAAELSMVLRRVPTVGIDAGFVSGLVDLVQERASIAAGGDPHAPGWPEPRPLPVDCPAGCCPNLRVAKPAVCGAD